jgi:hypothetical protein
MSKFGHPAPAEELVHHARPDDPVPAADGSRLVIELPNGQTTEGE